MKSFEQFEYEKSLMDESIVGTNVGQRFQRGNTSASGYSRMMQGKSPEPNRRQKNLQDKKDLKAGIIRDPKTGKKRGSANNDPKKQTVKSTGTGAKSNIAGKGFQAPNIPTRPGRLNDGTKKSGIQATIDRNTARAKEFAKSDRGKMTGSVVGGALGAARAYKPDKEAVDTGASGMGTQMRQLGGIGKAAMSGAIAGFKKRRAEVEKERKEKYGKTGTTGTKVTGPTDTRPGSTGASSFFGGLLKSGIKKAVGIKDDDDKAKTKGGKEITGDTRLRQPKSQTSDSASRTRSGKGGETGTNKANMSDSDKKINKQINYYLGKGAENKKAQREIDKQMKVADADKAAKAQAEKDEADDYKKRTAALPPGKKGGELAKTSKGSASPEAKKNFTQVMKTLKGSKPDQPKLTSTDKKGGETDSPMVKGAISAAEKENKRRKKADAGADRLMAAMRKQAEKDDKSGDKAITVKATTVPKKPKEEKPKEQKLKRPNIRSYKGDREGYEKARAAYNAQKPENKTKVGKQGRPKKNKDIKEATGRIAMMKAAKEKGKVIKMRTYSQMKQDEAREAALKNAQKKTGQFEQFSHWREEFLWEVDKKYPDKVKEIKPMSGKNTIIINPEDESAKYKRGY
jgi:hypothetical protein